MLAQTSSDDDDMANLLCSMRQNRICHLIKRDPLIKKYGSRRLTSASGGKRQRRQYASCKMREMGRLLDHLHKNQEFKKYTMKDFLVVEKFGDLVKAVKEICAFDKDARKYQIPSLALKIGHSLKRMANILLADAIERKNSVDQRSAEQFIKLYDMEWTHCIASRAHTTLLEAKWNRPPLLPITEDVQKMQKTLSDKMSEMHSAIENGECSKQNFRELAQATLAKIILFNRKRQGEAGRIEISTYIKRNTTPLSSEIRDSLTKSEQFLLTALTRLVTRGKKRPVRSRFTN